MIEVTNRDMSITLKVLIFFAYDDIHYKKKLNISWVLCMLEKP